MEHQVYIPAERQKKIIEYIEKNTSAQIHELSEAFGVSEATVRRDLDDLDRQGAVRRTHGGAMKLDRSTAYEHVYSEKITLMKEEKRRIAARAAEMVHAGDTVIIDSGTTTFFIAQALSDVKNLTVITNDLYIAYEIPLHHTSTMVVTGGMRRTGRQELVGTVTENFIRNTHVDISFVGVDGISLTGGLSIANFQEVGAKQLMLKAAERSVIVTDSTKFGRMALAWLCDLHDTDLLITDNGVDPETLMRIKKLGAEISLV